MNLKKAVGSLSLILGLAFSAQVSAQEIRNTKEYNLQLGVGLQGYDPVSYFQEGGGVPKIGLKNLKLDYLGVTYFFATAQNLEIFVTDPNKFEPSYGGWCAFAMATGGKIEISPKYYTINNRRLHFFVNNRAKQNFDRDIKGFEINADGFWKDISGESPRN